MTARRSAYAWQSFRLEEEVDCRQHVPRGEGVDNLARLRSSISVLRSARRLANPPVRPAVATRRRCGKVAHERAGDRRRD